MTAQKEINCIVVEKRLFEMDVEATVYRIRDGRIEHTLAELREMPPCEQLQAGAVGFTDLAERRDPDEICTYVVETLECDPDKPEHPPRRVTREDHPTAQSAFNAADKLAQQYRVLILDHSQTPHHLILLGDDTLLDRAFNLSQAEKLLAYYVGHGEDAYLAESIHHDTLSV